MGSVSVSRTDDSDRKVGAAHRFDIMIRSHLTGHYDHFGSFCFCNCGGPQAAGTSVAFHLSH